MLKTKAVSIDAGSAPENFTGKIKKEDPDTILIVDAADLGKDPGDFAILARDEILSSGFTTHDLSPAMLMEYLETETDADIYMLGIQPAKVGFGEGLSGVIEKALKEVDVLVGYYSTGFDIPFMRTRAEIHGFDFPSFGTVKHFDLYYLIRNKFSLTRKSLRVACEALGLDKKGHCGIDVWNAARIGNAEAIAEIYDYNKQDVFITMELFERVKKYRKITRKSI